MDAGSSSCWPPRAIIGGAAPTDPGAVCVGEGQTGGVTDVLLLAEGMLWIVEGSFGCLSVAGTSREEPESMVLQAGQRNAWPASSSLTTIVFRHFGLGQTTWTGISVSCCRVRPWRILLGFRARKGGQKVNVC